MKRPLQKKMIQHQQIKPLPSPALPPFALSISDLPAPKMRDCSLFLDLAEVIEKFHFLFLCQLDEMSDFVAEAIRDLLPIQVVLLFLSQQK